MKTITSRFTQTDDVRRTKKSLFETVRIQDNIWFLKNKYLTHIGSSIFVV